MLVCTALRRMYAGPAAAGNPEELDIGNPEEIELDEEEGLSDVDIGGPTDAKRAAGHGDASAAPEPSGRSEGGEAAAQEDSMFVAVEMHSYEPAAGVNGMDEDVDVGGGEPVVPDAIAAVLEHARVQQEGREP